jgi:hypothetical protein
MALITTKYSLGWYGVHGPSGCSSLSIPDQFGKYTAAGSFIKGAAGLSEDQAGKLQVVTMQDNGTPTSWNLPNEKRWRHDTQMGPIILKLNNLECGQMYWFIWSGDASIAVNVPGYCPTAHGVDMGRISV